MWEVELEQVETVESPLSSQKVKEEQAASLETQLMAPLWNLQEAPLWDKVGALEEEQ